MEQVIIVGSGCAGLTAALYTARANLNPLVIEGKQPGGQLTTTSEVENFPGFPEGIDGFELTDKIHKQAARFGSRFSMDHIESIKLDGPVKQLQSATKTYETKALILCTGASPRFLGIPGESEMFGGKGVTTCATCDGAFYRDQEVVVIGGGDSACEEALFLTHFCSKISLIHRRDELRASKVMAHRILSNEKIEPIWNSVVEKILSDESGHVRGVQVKNVQTLKVHDMPCKGVFIAVGYIPNTNVFANSLALDKKGYICTTNGVCTSIPGVFAAGDCTDPIYQQAVTAAATGCRAAIECERWLANESCQ